MDYWKEGRLRLSAPQMEFQLDAARMLWHDERHALSRARKQKVKTVAVSAYNGPKNVKKPHAM